ncbi:coiled-coil domain-containing protein 157 isoform X1 [Salmo trutta]|uniref:coiled-coil domain-containing protein 157 isoform X1 n=1 Tax=Salmo trutta TaxID=8032 RepID=UPI00113060B3|nr:coiled-coil domain-containing protein 157-like isoform X1 [Salmo trutta]
MTHLLGRQDCVESLRRDLIDLQGAVLDVFSRTGPVRFPSWKFPDKLSCNLDLVSLLEQYDFVDGEEEFNQHSHIVLLELVIDRLLLLLQSFNAHAQLKLGQKRENIQQKGPCVSIGLVVRHYWNNLIQVGNQRASMKQDIQEVIKTPKCEENTTFSSASSLLNTKSDLCPQSPSTVSQHCTSRTAASTPLCPPQKILNGSLSCPTHRTASSIPSCLPLISTDTCNVSCQTVVSSLVPCDACAQVQSTLRETGDALVELCRSEGLPSSLQRLLVAVDDTLEQGHLTAGDVSQWSIEQRRDMGRVGKHLLEVRSTVQPLRNSLQAAEREREEFRAQLGRAQEELKRERATHQASKKQLEQRLQEAQVSREDTERRLQEEHEELRRGTVSLEDSNSKLKAGISLQKERLHQLECERDELHQEVKTMQVEEEARSKLEEKTQVLEAQLSTTQLLLDKEKSKYQNACRQQESLQAKQRSLLERVDALDQECEELQGQLGKSEDRQTDLQERLTHISEEKDQLETQLTQEQALCSELQQEKQRLESHVGELKDSVNQLRGEVQELAQRERLLVAFPELNPLPQGSPQSTGDVFGDMEQQFQANYVRIRVLEQENSTLHSSLVKLKDRAQLGASMVESKITCPSSCGFTQSLPDTPRESQLKPTSYVQHSPIQTSSAGLLKHGVRKKGADEGAIPMEMRPRDHLSTATSSLSATSTTSLVHQQTLRLSSDTSAARTYTRIRQASRTRSVCMHQRKK